MIESRRGYIIKNEDGSEIVNYNEPHFPAYIHEGFICKRAPWGNNPHFHQDIELISIIKGAMAYNVSGNEILLNEGDTLFVNSNQLHYSLTFSEEKTYYKICVVNPILLCSCSEVENKFVRPVIEKKETTHLLFKSNSEESRQIYDSLVRMHGNITNEFCFVKELFRIWDIILENFADALNTNTKPDNRLDILKCMLTYIQNNYRKNITLSDIASSGNVGKTYCNQLFRKYTSMPPMENLARFRCKKVTDYLISGNLSMSDIAELTGFSGASYMTETFKNIYGESPKQYQKRMQNTVN